MMNFFGLYDDICLFLKKIQGGGFFLSPIQIGVTLMQSPRFEPW
jgi:hypothetical protein